MMGKVLPVSAGVTQPRPNSEHHTRAAVPIVPSRVNLPPLRAGLIERRGVLARLDACDTSPLVSIVAPPGFGKTTVLSQWLASQRRPFGAMVLDEGMNDPSVFVTHLAYALEHCFPYDPDIWSALRSPTRRVRLDVIARLSAAAASAPGAWVLAIDEAHRLEDEQALGMLQMLVDNTSEGSQVVLAARKEPSLRLARLRVSRDSTELGPHDLRLEADEVQSVLETLGVEHDAAGVEKLVAQTEGWPVAVYLAAQAIRDGGDIGRIGGKDWAVADSFTRSFWINNPRRFASSLWTLPCYPNCRRRCVTSYWSATTPPRLSIRSSNPRCF